MSRNFWVAWLRIAAIGTIGLGLISLAATHPAGATVWHFLFDLVLWSFDEAPVEFNRDARLLNGITGGVLIGWGVLLTWLAGGPIARGEQGARRAAMICVTAWFVGDSLGSLLAGVPGNVVLNLGFFFLFMIPLIALGTKANARPAAQMP